MRRIVLRTYGKILAAFFTFWGTMTGCNFIEPRVEYGTPTADFIVKGKVTDKTTQQPIKNMAVINKSATSPYGNDTVRTDSEGKYELKFTATAFGAEDLTVYASDIDDQENGWYASDTLRIKASELKRIAKQRGNWHFGTFEKTGADFLLEHQPAAVPMYGIRPATYK